MVAGITHKQLGLGLIVLVVLSAIRMPFEKHLGQRLTEAKFRESEMSMSLRDDIGTEMMAVALGGSRSLVATVIDFEAFDHWQRNDFERVDLANRWIQKLQPDSYHYWDWSAYQAAYNAASFEKFRHEAENTEQSEDWGERYDQWVNRGIEILEEATVRLPDDYRLHGFLAEIHRLRVRKPDPCVTAKYYKRTMECPGSKGYHRRFYGYELAKCPGNEKEAYAILREFYDKEELRYPTLMRLLQNLEIDLALPESERIQW